MKNRWIAKANTTYSISVQSEILTLDGKRQELTWDYGDYCKSLEKVLEEAAAMFAMCESGDYIRSAFIFLACHSLHGPISIGQVVLEKDKPIRGSTDTICRSLEYQLETIRRRVELYHHLEWVV